MSLETADFRVAKDSEIERFEAVGRHFKRDQPDYLNR